MFLRAGACLSERPAHVSPSGHMFPGDGICFATTAIIRPQAKFRMSPFPGRRDTNRFPNTIELSLFKLELPRFFIR